MIKQKGATLYRFSRLSWYLPRSKSKSYLIILSVSLRITVFALSSLVWGVRFWLPCADDMILGFIVSWIFCLWDLLKLLIISQNYDTFTLVLDKAIIKNACNSFWFVVIKCILKSWSWGKPFNLRSDLAKGFGPGGVVNILSSFCLDTSS